MTKYAFVIDQRKCIGCHACTVACKAEHDIPIGVYRTWVKYVERGEFPNSRRYFLVNRCNHCDDAPCVKICPTKALYKRADGIVDFDSNRCIGCKSCMQACPYDALYIDPSSHTAAKCNYCAHRTELGMEPACVVVCPEHAIIAGDMHNPATEIAQIIAREPVRVRKPEQGTKPNVYYLGADEATINPEAAVQELPHMTMWSTMLRPKHENEGLFDAGKSLRVGTEQQHIPERDPHRLRPQDTQSPRLRPPNHPTLPPSPPDTSGRGSAKARPSPPGTHEGPARPLNHPVPLHVEESRSPGLCADGAPMSLPSAFQKVSGRETLPPPQGAGKLTPLRGTRVRMSRFPLKDGESSAPHTGQKLIPINPLKPYQPAASNPTQAHIVYDTPKDSAPWGWMVSTYLGTKSIGAGVMIVAALALALYGLQGSIGGTSKVLLGITAPIIGGLFIAITLVLLVADLKRPERAFFLITKANPTSWLVWGGYILGIFGLLEAIWFGAAFFGFATLLRVLLIPTALLGAAAAGYTAFLFGQAEGRDFWQSPLLLPILLVQAILAGAAALGIFSWIVGIGGRLTSLFTFVLLAAIIIHVLLIFLEVFGSHSNSHVSAAAHTITGGPLKTIFRALFLAVGSLLPVVLLVIALLVPGAQPVLLSVAGVAALVGLFAYEHCFVVAGQAVALS